MFCAVTVLLLKADVGVCLYKTLLGTENCSLTDLCCLYNGTAREEAKAQAAVEKAALKEILAAENRQWRASLLAAGEQGRDIKALDLEVERARQEAAVRSLENKQVAEAMLAAENR